MNKIYGEHGLMDLPKKQFHQLGNNGCWTKDMFLKNFRLLLQKQMNKNGNSKRNWRNR